MYFNKNPSLVLCPWSYYPKNQLFQCDLQIPWMCKRKFGPSKRCKYASCYHRTFRITWWNKLNNGLNNPPYIQNTPRNCLKYHQIWCFSQLPYLSLIACFSKKTRELVLIVSYAPNRLGHIQTSLFKFLIYYQADHILRIR